MTDIAQRTKDLRKALGGRRAISQTALGERIGYSRTYISGIERGEYPDPGPEYVYRIEILEQLTAQSQRQENAYSDAQSQTADLVVREGDALKLIETKRWGPHKTMPPPHALPPLQLQSPSRFNEPLIKPLADSEYADVCSMLTTLFDRFPQAFRMAAASIRGIHDALVNLKK